MFEEYAEYFWIALFAALVLYGLANAIQVPLVVKKFYKRAGLTDQGQSVFADEPLDRSVLLKGMMTPAFYTGTYRNHNVSQFEMVSVDRRKFTLNKVARKRNQLVWTITAVHLDTPLPEFCARPTRVVEAPGYILEEQGVVFPEDESFANKVHVIAKDHAAVRKLFTVFVRERLTGLDPVSLESVGNVLMYKSPRAPHDAGSTLEKELNLLVDIVESVLTQSENG